VPIQVHQVGEEIRRIAGEGRLLTLAPLFPLEGGLDVYLELAAGPFGWRINPFLPDAEKRALHLASAGDLNNLLRTTPPRAILTGLEPGLEDPLKAYARAHSFVPHPLSNGATLWLPPQ
jgi:hypothetical protein